MFFLYTFQVNILESESKLKYQLWRSGLIRGQTSAAEFPMLTLTGVVDLDDELGSRLGAVDHEVALLLLG